MSNINTKLRVKLVLDVVSIVVKVLLVQLKKGSTITILTFLTRIIKVVRFNIV